MDGHDPRDLSVDGFFDVPLSQTDPELAGVFGRELCQRRDEIERIASGNMGMTEYWRNGRSGGAELAQTGEMNARVLVGDRDGPDRNGAVEAEMCDEALALCHRFPIYAEQD